jgi:hypothetical protein
MRWMARIKKLTSILCFNHNRSPKIRGWEGFSGETGRSAPFAHGGSMARPLELRFHASYNMTAQVQP